MRGRVPRDLAAVAAARDHLAIDHDDGSDRDVAGRASRPRLVERDRYALRAGALLLLVAAGFVAGPDKDGRLAAAFDWRSDTSVTRLTRIDAWIDPPPYTGKPPLVLLGANAAPEGEAPISAPVGSMVVVRAAGPSRVTATG